MNGIYFDIDFTALTLLLICFWPFFLLFRWHKKFKEPDIAFNLETDVSDETRLRWIQWQPKLEWLAFLFFVIAFIDPHLFIKKEYLHEGQPEPTQGIAIYLVLDQSGSMKDKVFTKIGGQQQLLSKIDILKTVSKEFVEGDPSQGLYGRPNDLIGLIFFARAARIIAPLTLDHNTIVQKLDTFQAVKERDQDGTSLGYALYKTVNLITAYQHFSQDLIDKGKPAYLIKNTIIILITDGLQDPNPLDKGKRFRNIDVPEAAAYAKEHGVRMYMVNLDPEMSTEEFAPYHHIMQRAAELTGGKFYMVDSNTDLQQVYHDIDRLEKSTLPPSSESLQKDKRPDLYLRLSLYPYLIALGLLSLLLAILLETAVIRRVP